MKLNIKFLVMDVDGTLTDGKIYMSDKGELFKAFDIKDGYGIHDILPQYGIIPVIITARSSKILEHRCKELEITECYQGCRQKFDRLKTILADFSDKDNVEYTLQNVAYIGDDILDLKCMELIKKSGGIIGCPSDSVKEVIEVADYVCKRKGGEGAVREFISVLILNSIQTDCINSFYKKE